MGLRMKEGTHERALFRGCESDARANLKPRRVQLGGAGGGASEGSRKPARYMAGSRRSPRSPPRTESARVMSDDSHRRQDRRGGVGMAGSSAGEGAPGETTERYRPPSGRGKIIIIVVGLLVGTNGGTPLTALSLPQPPRPRTPPSGARAG